MVQCSVFNMFLNIHCDNQQLNVSNDVILTRGDSEIDPRLELTFILPY